MSEARFWTWEGKDFRWRPDTSEQVHRFLRKFGWFLKAFRTFPGPSPRMCFTKHTGKTVSRLFPWKSENWEKCIIICMDFFFVCQLSSNSSNFSARQEIFVHSRHAYVWSQFMTSKRKPRISRVRLGMYTLQRCHTFRIFHSNKKLASPLDLSCQIS